jgi:DNA-binding MarR family transcriptional regulator
VADARKQKGPVRGWPQVRVFRELLRADAWVVQHTRAFVERQTGLTMTEFDMLAELGNQAGIRMSDLATKMVVSAANVTRVAQSLAAKGLVVRERAAHSDREVLARLTPEGERMFRLHFPQATEFMASLIDSQLTPGEQEQLGELLGKMGKSPSPER